MYILYVIIYFTYDDILVQLCIKFLTKFLLCLSLVSKNIYLPTKYRSASF